MLIAVIAMSPLVQDPSQFHNEWILTLSDIFHRSYRFGVDIMFTFGPWGFVWGAYHPKTFAITCTVWACIGAVIWWAGFRAISFSFMSGSVSKPNRTHVAAGILLVLWAMLLQGTNCEYSDSRFLLLPFFLLIHAFLVARRTDALTIILSVAMAFAGTVKFTYLVANCLAIGAIAFAPSRPSWSRLVPGGVFLFGFLFFWVIAGQSIADIPAFLRTSIWVVEGYPEAMQITQASPWREVFPFLLIAIGVIAIARRGTSEMSRGSRAVFVLALAGLFWLVFRASYVRHDVHAAIAAGWTCAAVPIFAMVFWPRLQSRWSRSGMAASVVLAAGLQAFATSRYEERAMPPFSPTVTATNFWQCGRQLICLARGEPTAPAADYEQMMADLRRNQPLPALQGTVDMIPEDPRSLFANGLKYDPRPTLESYCAYTPALAQANVAKYSGPTAPDHVLFQLASIDRRLANLEDNRLWLSLLERYRLDASYGDFLHLLPRAVPRRANFTSLSEREAAINQMFDVPAPPPGQLLWAKIEVKHSAMGKLCAAIYKPFSTRIAAELPDGTTHVYRFIISNGSDGFLLGPIIDSNDEFAALSEFPSNAESTGKSLRAKFPIRCAIQPSHFSLTSRFFEPTLHVQFFAIALREKSSASPHVVEQTGKIH